MTCCLFWTFELNCQIKGTKYYLVVAVVVVVVQGW